MVHVENTVDPVRDLDIIMCELCKKDLAILNQAVASEERTLRRARE